MSYVSGFMMGAAIGKSIRQMFESSETAAIKAKGRAAAIKPVEPLALVAKTAGRRRYRAVMSPALAKLLEEKLNKLNFLLSVKINAVSGSLLFTYDTADEIKMDALAAWLKNHVFTPKTGNGKNTKVTMIKNDAELEPNMPAEAHAGSITRSIRNMARSFSAWIKDHTCGWFDISSIASLMFLFRGLRKMILTKQYPSGAQMLWWALSLMRGWRTV